MIRAAIVGLGWWGRNLVNAVRDHRALLCFTVAHTRNPAPVAAFCREHELHWVGDLDAVLADPALDAVVFATPHSAHAGQVRRAAAAGKAVFVEKPFTLGVAEAEAAIEAAERAGIVLAVGFNRRFHPSMGHLRRAVREQRLGTIVSIIAEQTSLHGLQLAADAWRAQPNESPAGAMTPIGVHLIDGMIDLLGHIRDVTALTTRRAAPHGGDDTTSVLLSFANGATGHLFCSVAATPSYRMAVYGTLGLAEVLFHPMHMFRLTPSADPAQLSGATPEVIETPGFNMLTAELTEFARCVADHRPFPTPLSDILHGVDVFEAIAQSAETRRTVVVRP
ncbi:MAG TPA: Gfo/Idh/MocA family oxidoreductase [Acetobacteraceae bacterium]|nr:Gfo/Idh/MocA family oxidoreductase [Acetobacteraceae bacterium]